MYKETKIASFFKTVLCNKTVGFKLSKISYETATRTQTKIQIEAKLHLALQIKSDNE